MAVAVVSIIGAVGASAAVFVTVGEPQVTKTAEGEDFVQEVTLANEIAHYTLNYDVSRLTGKPNEITSHWWQWQQGYIPIGMTEPSNPNWYWQAFMRWTFDGESLHTLPATMRVVRESGPDGMIEYSWDAPKARVWLRFAMVTGSDKLLATSELWPERNEVPEGYDPLGYLIQKAHEVGIEVHPWFSVMYRRQGFRNRFPVDINIRNRDGSIVSSGADVHRPEFRDYMVSVMLDVAKNYEIDGILLDYIRIMTECYCDKCQAEFEAQFGKPLAEATDEERIAWHRQAVGDIVRRAHEGLAEIRPQAKLWASIFATMSAGALQGQDGATWAAEGWLDVVTPMDYKVQTVDLMASERQWQEAVADNDRLAPALSLYLHSGNAGAVPRTPELVAEQITALRVMGIHGYALFRYGLMSDELLEKLQTEVNTEPAVPYFR